MMVDLLYQGTRLDEINAELDEIREARARLTGIHASGGKVGRMVSEARSRARPLREAALARTTRNERLLKEARMIIKTVYDTSCGPEHQRKAVKYQAARTKYLEHILATSGAWKAACSAAAAREIAWIQAATQQSHSRGSATRADIIHLQEMKRQTGKYAEASAMERKLACQRSNEMQSEAESRDEKSTTAGEPSSPGYRPSTHTGSIVDINREDSATVGEEEAMHQEKAGKASNISPRGDAADGMNASPMDPQRHLSPPKSMSPAHLASNSPQFSPHNEPSTEQAPLRPVLTSPIREKSSLYRTDAVQETPTPQSAHQTTRPLGLIIPKSPSEKSSKSSPVQLEDRLSPSPVSSREITPRGKASRLSSLQPLNFFFDDDADPISPALSPTHSPGACKTKRIILEEKSVSPALQQKEIKESSGPHYSSSPPVTAQEGLIRVSNIVSSAFNDDELAEDVYQGSFMSLTAATTKAIASDDDEFDF